MNNVPRSGIFEGLVRQLVIKYSLINCGINTGMYRTPNAFATQIIMDLEITGISIEKG
jgi:hypothetical protein